METNVKKAKLRKYTYTYVTYKDLGNMFLSFVTDLVVMLLPIAIWDAVMIGIFGSVLSISGLNMVNGITFVLLVISSLLLNPLISSYTRGKTLGMSLYGFQVMHISGRRSNMHVVRLREFLGNSIPLCIALVFKQPLLIIGYYALCAAVCVIDKKHRVPFDFLLQTCMMKIGGKGDGQVKAEPKCPYDFHIHSSFSRNGEKGIEEILKYAKENEMKLISITDVNIVQHNFLAHSLAEKYGVHYLTGIEMKAVVQECIVSVLGYGFDYRNDKFKELENKCIIAEKNASLMRIDAFSSVLGKKINADEIMKTQRFPKVSGETIAKYVLEHEDFKDCPLLAKYREMDEAYAYKKLALNYFYVRKNENGHSIKGSCYVEEKYPQLSDVVQLIKENKGVCILADACSLYEDDDLLLYEVIKEGIDGLEIFRPDVLNQNLQKEVLKIAKDKGLMVLCGSDFYSSGKGRAIGECGKMTPQDEAYVGSFFRINGENVNQETNE